jgi:DNA-binding MarR family transcriptional regulator
MPNNCTQPFSSLNRIFHEPSRLAIVSALCGSERGMSFNDLKEHCTLTDGNLSRHLKTLEEAGTIRVRKSTSGRRPRTTVRISEKGREQFIQYLTALENVLHTAALAVGKEESRPSITELLGGMEWTRGMARNP